MSDFNHVILAGRLTRDPELSYTPNQTAICKFGLASNHKWTGKDNQDHEEVLFIDCVAFGHMANRAAKCGAKGAEVIIEGRLKLDTWTGQNGAKHTRHTVVVEHLLLDRAESEPPATGPSKPQESRGQSPVPDEEIPF